MLIRKADKQKDYDQTWEIFKSIISTGDTYVYEPDTPKEKLLKYWFADDTITFVIEDKSEILGTYIIKPNQIDLGNHVANCSYMVSPKHQGKGIGKLLCKHSIDFAKEKGFISIIFNMVVSTNVNAIKLWQKFGFKIIGTIPKAFRLKNFGLVDAYIMYKDLSETNFI